MQPEAPAPPVLCLGDAPRFRRILEKVNAVTRRQNTVVLTGESGTGKEMFARYIHAHSPRADKPFVPVDCTNLTGSLLASQLFGHVKGAFTGADSDTLGLFRAADGGTVFLDEIGELQPDVQARLLRVLQESAVTPVGATSSHPIDVRVLCATHRDLHTMVRRGDFRQDLYFRLNVVNVHIPPLRERQEDIIGLAEHFLAQQARLYDEPVKTLSADTRHLLRQYTWPGNVRELANAMEHGHIFAGGAEVTPDALPDFVKRPDVDEKASQPVPTLDQANRQLIVRALQHTGGRRMAAANLLGVERRRLNRMIAHYRIDLEVVQAES